MDLAQERIPVQKVEFSTRVEMFQKQDSEACLLEKAGEGLMIVESFVIVGPGSMSAGFDIVDVFPTGMKTIRDGNPKIAPRSQELKTGFRGPESISFGEVFPDVFRKNRVNRVGFEEIIPVGWFEEIQLIDFCRDPAVIMNSPRADHQFQRSNCQASAKLVGFQSSVSAKAIGIRQAVEDRDATNE